MRLSPASRARLIRFLRLNEGVRVAVCIGVMLSLVEGGVPLWLALPFPILTYVGLAFLLSGTAESAPAVHVESVPNKSGPHPADLAAYKRCVQRRDEIGELALGIGDGQVVSSLEMIARRFGQILSVIEEDEKYEASPALEHLAELTKKYIVFYVKALRRELDHEEPIAGIRQSFAVLSNRFERFWIELNKDLFVNLKTLREIIDEAFPDPPAKSDEPDPRANGDSLTAVPAPAIPPAPMTVPNEAFADVEFEQAAENAEVIIDQEEIRMAVERAKQLESSGHLPIQTLTPREKDVLCLVIHGKRDAEIAELLFLSKRTPPKHMENIMRKLGARSRTMAAMEAVKLGLVDPNRCLDRLESDSEVSSV
jgi:DNA-binding CsgD family transcriptional regulator